MRIEPPMSEPVASVEVPEASDAPEPPDEPPTPNSGFHGLRVTPCRREWVNAAHENSGRRRARVDDRAGVEHPLGERGRVLGDEVLVDQRALRPRLARDRLLLLDRERDALERPRLLAACPT